MDSSARACATDVARTVTETKTRPDWCEMDWIYRAKVEAGQVPSLYLPFTPSTDQGDDEPDDTLTAGWEANQTGTCPEHFALRSASGRCSIDPLCTA